MLTILWAAVFSVASVAGTYGVPRTNEEKMPFDRLQLFTELSQIITSNMNQTDHPYPIFHGSIDWHSCVHGHWALFRIARTEPSLNSFAQEAAKHFTHDGVKQEWEYLRSSPNFEMPYGRAWFLRLFIDYDLWRKTQSSQEGDAETMAEMADFVAQSLIDYYNYKSPDPHDPEYENASWAMVQLYFYYQYVNNSPGLDRIKAYIRWMNSIDTHDLNYADDLTSGQFFSRIGNLGYLAAHAFDDTNFANFLIADPIPFEDLKPIQDKSTDHSLGLNWSRAWAFKALKERILDPKAKDALESAFQAHALAGMKAHELYKNDRHAYSHWIPQFMVYALTENQ